MSHVRRFLHHIACLLYTSQDAVERVAGVLGNQLKRLDTPNIVTIFVGIFLGILLGSCLLYTSEYKITVHVRDRPDTRSFNMYINPN